MIHYTKNCEWMFHINLIYSFEKKFIKFGIFLWDLRLLMISLEHSVYAMGECTNEREN